MRERDLGGRKEDLMAEIQALRAYAEANGGLRVPGRPSDQLWILSRIDEETGLAYLVRVEGGVRQNKNDVDVHELWQLNLQPASTEGGQPQESVEHPDSSNVVTHQTVGAILERLHDIWEREDMAGSAAESRDRLIEALATIQNRISDDEVVEGSLIIQVPTENGLQEEVLQILSPDFSQDEDLYAIKARLVKAKVQHDEFRQVGVVFMKKSDGKEFDVDDALKILDDFIDIIERDTDTDISENDPRYIPFTSNYGLKDAVKKAVRVHTAKTGRTAVPIK